MDYTSAEIGISEDEYSISVGLAGIYPGNRCEVIIQSSKQFEDQDRKLEMDKLHFEYNGRGGYGIISNIAIVGNIDVHINLNDGKASALGLRDSNMVFKFDTVMDDNYVRKIEQLCGLTATPFSISQ